MNHLNKWDWYTASDSYETYDYLECPKCKSRNIEFYHTEFIDNSTDELPRPKFNLYY